MKCRYDERKRYQLGELEYIYFFDNDFTKLFMVLKIDFKTNFWLLFIVQVLQD